MKGQKYGTVFFSLRQHTVCSADKCVGCGKCSRLCPLNNIEMTDRRPVWKKPCAHCMACILNCPFEAIEYGSITQKKEKYNISHYAG